MRYVLAVLALGATSLRAGELSPEQIQTAIDAGLSAKRVDGKALSRGNAMCVISTPESRIQIAAGKAKKEYRTFTVADVTDDMRSSATELVCPSVDAGYRHGIANVLAVVVTAKGGADPIQPTKKAPMPEEYQNAYGAKWEHQGLIVEFPPDALKPGAELHVVYNIAVRVGDFTKPKEDVAIEIK